MLDIISDCLSDSLKMLPLIFLTYVIIELIERKADFAKNGRFLTGKAAPVLGSLAGAFPQCGISVMSEKLYGKLVSAKQNGVEVVKTEKGITYFDESNTATNRSAPYFDIDIDGIEVVA